MIITSQDNSEPQFRILGIDGGFAESGFAILGWNPPYEPQIEWGHRLKTKKDSRKRKTTVRSDDTRRLGIILDKVEEILNEHEILAIGIESLSLPRHAGVSAKLGMAWGGMYALAHRRSIPVYQFSPQDLKKGIGLTRSAPKKDVIAVMTKKWPSFKDWPRRPQKGTIYDHVADAAAAAFLTTQQPELQAVMHAIKDS